jgi:hypothetical protein
VNHFSGSPKNERKLTELQLLNQVNNIEWERGEGRGEGEKIQSNKKKREGDFWIHPLSILIGKRKVHTA